MSCIILQVSALMPDQSVFIRKLGGPQDSKLGRPQDNFLYCSVHMNATAKMKAA